MYVCVCVCVCVFHEIGLRHCSHTTFVLGSFARSILLVWFGAKVMQCHVTLTFLFIVDVTPDENLIVSLCFVDLWENRLRYRINFNRNGMGSGYGLSNDTIISFTPSPDLVIKNITKIGFSTFKWWESAVKFFLSTTSSSKVVCAYVRKTNVKKSFLIDAYLCGSQ